MVELSLDPIETLLLHEPLGWHWVRAQSPATASQELDHCQRVVALLGFDPKPRSDPLKKESRRLAGRAPPIPGFSSVQAALPAYSRSHHLSRPHVAKPLQHQSIPITYDHNGAVIELASSAHEASGYRDTAFAVHKSGCVGPIGGLGLLSHRGRPRRSAPGPVRSPGPLGTPRAAAPRPRSPGRSAPGRHRPVAARRSRTRRFAAPP
jgi:hypothetical protein